MNAPFPYFGGKSKIAHIVWQALGSPKHYIEPFFGSGAVLLLRPNYSPTQHTETICDKDGFISNVWRSLQFSPKETARWCDWPVNHADLSARKKKLIENEKYLLENLIKDDMWHDPKLAGYWIWAASCWIGSGLTSISQIPHLGGTGMGVHKIGKVESGIYDWFNILSERLRYVKVVCGDWTRVCGGNWQDNMGDVGMFFDPPYGVKDRDTNVYHHDSTEIAKDVLEWVRERGKNKTYRIVVAGYEEYSELIKEGWTMQKWKTNGGVCKYKKGQRQ